jgi:hypothetical protein
LAGDLAQLGGRHGCAAAREAIDKDEGLVFYVAEMLSDQVSLHSCGS